MTQPNFELFIVTGMSGAGKTIAMQSLEDAGFYCVDNLPPQLIPKFSTLLEHAGNDIRQVALAIDLRTLDFFEELPKALQEIQQIQHIPYQMVFLDANDQVLIQRYKQSRRKHPLATEDSLLSGIQSERTLLKPLYETAHYVVDTSNFKPEQLKQKVVDLLAEKKTNMMVNVMSFGFKYGIPLDADLVFDVRFLPNPYYVPELRPRNGKEEDVAEYVFQGDKGDQYAKKLFDFLSFSLPQYEEEGKQQLVIAIGCTGGKHRSVAMVEKIGKALQNEHNVYIKHRDLGRE